MNIIRLKQPPLPESCRADGIRPLPVLYKYRDLSGHHGGMIGLKKQIMQHIHNGIK
jgi:hypothetical protein